MTSRETKIALAAMLNVFFTILEIVGGIWTNSLAILSDALHDFGDSVALVSSLILERGARKAPDRRRTFGYQRLSLFAGLFSALVLASGSMLILYHTIPRLLQPEHVEATGMMSFAILGIVFNGIGFVVLKRGKSVSERVLSWHLLEDVLGWIVILIGGFLISVWDNHFFDPLMTVGITVYILYGVSNNLREVMNILLQGVPQHINLDAVQSDLSAIPGVLGVHDIHIWSLEGETDVFTGHLVVDDARLDDPDRTRRVVKDVLKRHHIEHSTIELESEAYCSGIECQLPSQDIEK